MFDRIRNYFYERRRALCTGAAVAGGFYLAGKYVTERLQEMRDQAIQMQKARENLRRRFTQNQEDVMFTIMAHLPTLGKAVIEGMDVESVTQELQSRSRMSRARAHSPNPPPSESSLSSSVDLGQPSSSVPPSQRMDAESPTGTEASAAPGSSTLSGMEESMMSGDSTSTHAQSWVQDFGSQTAGSSTNRGPALAIPAPSSQRQEPSLSSPYSNIGTGMSDSIMSESLASTSASVSENSHRAERSESSEQEGSALPSKSKAELWHEVKILTFTRTLTIIYSTTLLFLLTTMQLNIIGRSKYLQSIVQLHREEKLRELRTYQASISSLFFGGFPETEENLERWLSEDVQDVGLVIPDSERKFLTLSWWLLYVGWKDVGERVRRSVEEVLESVSLKARLGPLELHRLLQDIRRRVEHEVTYEGTERRINFLSTIIPPTAETLALVFGEGGVPGYRSSSSSSSYIHPTSSSSPYLPSSQFPSTSTATHPPNPESDPAFTRLLTELRTTASSPVFAAVLEASLDRATDVLLDGLRKNVFRSLGERGPGQEEEVEKPRLANLLPGLARWSHLALNTVPNELVESIMDLKEMTAFSAIIYSSYDERLR